MSGKKLVSPIRYPGGKSKLKKHFVEMFPNKEEIDTFIDFFMGGGSITIYACENGYKNILSNDINKNLVELHKGNGIDYEKLREIFDNDLNSIDDNRIAFESAKNNGEGFFIKNKMGFSGLQNSSFSPQASVKNATKSSVDRLEKMHELFCEKKVNILNKSYEEVPVSSKDFVFADPPYYENRKKELYGGTHSVFDHEVFCNYMKTLDCKWLITYDDCEFVREQFKNFTITEFENSYSMTNTGGNKCKKGKEIIIKNY